MRLGVGCGDHAPVRHLDLRAIGFWVGFRRGAARTARTVLWPWPLQPGAQRPANAPTLSCRLGRSAYMAAHSVNPQRRRRSAASTRSTPDSASPTAWLTISATASSRRAAACCAPSCAGTPGRRGSASGSHQCAHGWRRSKRGRGTRGHVHNAGRMLQPEFTSHTCSFRRLPYFLVLTDVLKPTWAAHAGTQRTQSERNSFAHSLHCASLTTSAKGGVRLALQTLSTNPGRSQHSAPSAVATSRQRSPQQQQGGATASAPLACVTPSPQPYGRTRHRVAVVYRVQQ